MFSFAHSISIFLLLSTRSFANGGVFTARQTTDLVNFVDNLMQCRGTVGLTVAVVKGNETWARGFGMADRESGRGVNTSDLFCIGSLTKAFVSALISIFLDQTSHSWNTPIVDILGKGFKFATEELTREVTLKDILSHRTGLENTDIPLFAGSHLTLPEYARRIRYLPVEKLFRDEFDYNNWMYALAGFVVEKMGGSRWEDLLHRHLLEPLNMTQSAVLGKTLSVWDDRLTNPYVLFRDQVTLSDRAVYDITPKDSAGAIVSSADDMAKWMRLLLNKGRTPDGRQLLSEGHWKEMTTPHVATRRRAQLVLPQFPVFYAADAYGLGWYTANYRGYPMVWHTGSLYAYTTYIGIVPGIDLGVFVSSNGIDGKNASHIIRQTFFHIADLVLGENPWLNISNACQYPQLWRGPSPPKPAPNITCDGHDFHKPDRYVGRYEHQLFEKVDITRNDSEGLYVRYNYLEGRLCRTDAENSAVFEVVGSMAFLYHPGSDPVYLRLNFSRWSAADGRYQEVSLGKATDTKHVLVFERGGKPQSSACSGDHGNGWRMGILLLAVAFFSLHLS